MKLGSKLITILYGTLVPFLVSATMAEALECRYTASGQAEMMVQGECGKFIEQDGFRISPSHLKKVLFKDGLAEVFVDDKAFYVDEKGNAARVHLFENGADYFSEGLARMIAGGKFGYIDKKLAVIIKPQYDFAFPFQNNRAIVCMGCAPVGEGEHHAIRGGKWGVIDKSGKVVVPVRYTKEKLDKMLEQSRQKAGKDLK